VTRVNQWGDFDLSYDRLAFIDGDSDPWVFATPHNPLLKPRADTIERPFKLIPGGVHHWDENGLVSGREPEEIERVHEEEVSFVKSWLKESERPTEVQ
jgi:hypothetical protein